jgi:hypothetical protein
MSEDRPWLNPHTDPAAQRAYGLIFNGLTGALTEFMPLPERARLAQAIFASLVDGGVEFRTKDGLAALREVDYLVSISDSISLLPCGCPRGVGEDIPGHNPLTCRRWEARP